MDDDALFLAVIGAATLPGTEAATPQRRQPASINVAKVVERDGTQGLYCLFDGALALKGGRSMHFAYPGSGG
ncbi:hypothetical protein [Ramlibacter sp.]|uniref:hypothetical protein n=1 Tax=Ramlibacter sp. TaxID=1917967 RepID=UPI00261EFE39|nr:hypothetical protein [Ramlibacter sp.]MDB5957910.1 hypothetical protein [Ramlibacter sp.]